MMTDKLNERFCKDLNLPIKIFVNPVFKSRILLYDNYYDCVKKYSDFINLVEEMGGEQKYFEYYNKENYSEMIILDIDKSAFEIIDGDKKINMK